MTEQNKQPGQGRRQFHIPTVEEIEQRRAESERSLAPAASMPAVSLDASTSVLLASDQHAQADQQPSQQPAPQAGASVTSATAASAGGAAGRSISQLVLVNDLQRGNPLLACIRNVRWSHSRDILPDFEISRSSCVLYLSIRYHRLHPEYITKRIDGLGRSYRMRVLLVFVDTDDSKIPLREINRVALQSDMTLLLAWSLDEAGRYIETLKAFENRSPDPIRERVDDSHMARVSNSLTAVRSVNKTDVLTLASNFGSFATLSEAAVEELALCPGIGELKAQRIFKAFNDPFVPEP
ncbi:ssDNA endonuclease and repair protein rad10 [Coemansia biformis]|uniref:DNA excision repair protein ERCC-1 n=1 Tax=Coemansia biformis TaxID=1286918 RepID=A0A9W7Y702_9FUNG|nr:ssDNA endonuclease and repair protein rad10 [Coemansia biformis]